VVELERGGRRIHHLGRRWDLDVGLKSGFRLGGQLRLRRAVLLDLDIHNQRHRALVDANALDHGVKHRGGAGAKHGRLCVQTDYHYYERARLRHHGRHFDEASHPVQLPGRVFPTESADD